MFNKGMPMLVCGAKVLLGLILSCLSIYLIWGWITISDIRDLCTRNGWDIDQVLETLAQNAVIQEHMVSSSANPFDIPLGTNPPGVNVIPGINRLSPTFYWGTRQLIHQTNIYTNGPSMKRSDGLVAKADDEISSQFSEVSLLLPFLVLSSNVVNVLFCFGVGYIISTIIVLLRHIQGKSIPKNYWLLRPVAGGAVSSFLFIIVISGGGLLWQRASGVNTLSVGIISVFGSVYCERFELMISKPLSARTKLADERVKD